MFYFVSYLDYNTHKITLHDFTQERDKVTNLLKDVATNFIRRENGESRIDTCFVKDEHEMTHDGYYLILSAEHNWVIELYKRTTSIVSGWFMNGADVIIEKVGRYGVAETTLYLPIHTTNSGAITKPHFDNIQTEVNYGNVLAELKEKQQSLTIQGCAIYPNKLAHYVPYFSEDEISESISCDYSEYESSSDEDSSMW